VDQEFEGPVAAISGQLPGAALKSTGLSLESGALTLIGMIDGFWIQYLLAPGRLDPQNAIQASLAYLSGSFPGFKEIMDG
jgi:hypothetical protein